MEGLRCFRCRCLPRRRSAPCQLQAPQGSDSRRPDGSPFLRQSALRKPRASSPWHRRGEHAGHGGPRSSTDRRSLPEEQTDPRESTGDPPSLGVQNISPAASCCHVRSRPSSGLADSQRSRLDTGPGVGYSSRGCRKTGTDASRLSRCDERRPAASNILSPAGLTPTADRRDGQ